ncbi:MAG: SOS response-associated peptidase [Candidatus Omnitrophota bacterium]
MCGRYTLRKSEIELAAMLAIIRHATTPRYNIAPSQNVPVFRIGPENNLECREMKWGLLPHWSKDSKSGYSTINARAETVKTKPAYRTPFKRQRCLIPADGWYEWQATQERKKQPWFFHLPADRLFYFAGLWDHWQDKNSGEAIDSCTIIVTGANETVKPVHDRMPVILEPKNHDAWLDPGNTDSESLEKMLIPYGQNDLQTHPVSTWVNNPRFDGPQCSFRLE